MSPERWQKIEDVFQAVVDLAPEERLLYLNANYADDADLIAEIERLIEDYEDAGDFIESPVWTDSFMLGATARDQIGDAINEEIKKDNGSMIGKRLGVYRLTKELGRGGMGAVYLAERADGEFRQRVALKVIKRGMDTDFIVRRFRNERQILASLNHPNIARLLDGGTTADGLPFFVMEYIEGKPVYKYSDSQKLSISERLHLFRRICAAVDHAHRNQIIHRDIKPSNIMITANGTPKLLDFGIAKILDPELAADSIDPTATAMRMMTPEYASPEQVRGEPVTKASDIYSLGVLLYELLTGHRPYRLKNRALHEIARVICEEEPENLGASLTREDNIVPTNGGDEQTTLEFIFENRNADRESLRRELSGDLEKIVRKALRKEPGERYQSALDFAADILRFLESRPVLAETFLTIEPKSKRILPKANAGEISVAVLPLKLFGAGAGEDTGDDYLCIGLADALITRLSNVRRFVVRPTSSVLQYGNSEIEPITAGEELGVNYVIDGNIRRVGTRLRVTIQLLNISEGAARWAEKFDEEFTDVLSLEDSISEKVAEALMPQLTGEERSKLKKRGTNSAEAFEHYLRGRHHWNNFTEDGFAKAIVAYHQAIAFDPNYALAYAGIADYYNWLGVYGVLPSKECFLSATENARKAIELDAELGEAYASLAFAQHGGNFEWEESERNFQTALRLNPNSAETHVWYSIKLTTEGRFGEGIIHAARALELDPQTPFNQHNLGWLLYYARQFERSLEQYKKTAEMFPFYPLAHYGLAWALRYLGRFDEAVNAANRAKELMSESVFSLHVQGQTFAAAGMREEAEIILEKLEELSGRQYVSPYHTAMIYAFLDEKEKALELLEGCLQTSEAWLVWLGVEPAFDGLRSEPRFKAVMSRTKNPILQRSLETKPEKSNPTLAVLPFKVINTTSGQSTDDKFLGVGLADSLITRLSNIRRFTVRPTSSVLQFDTHSEPFGAGRELDVDYLIDGSIRRVGETLRVTVQLLSIEENATRWARRFDEQITDILTLEDLISEQIVSEILPQLTGEEERQLKKRGTNNSRAHEAYLRGRYFWNKFTGETLPKAFESFNEAIALDANYALAYVGLADYYIWLCIFGFIPSPVAFPKAKEAAHKALEIDDTLGEGYTSLGFATLLHDWDWQGAETLFKRAIELSPNYPFAHEWYSNLLTGTGRFEEGLKEIRRAEELNPLSARSLLMTSWTLYQMRHYEEAIEKANKALELDRDLPQGLLHLGNALERSGRAAESIEVLEKSCALWEGALMPKYMLCYALAAANRIDEAQMILDEIKFAPQHVKPYFVAMAYNAVGKTDEAFEWFEKAFDEPSEWLIWFATEPKLDSIRGDRRYEKLFQRLNNPIDQKQKSFAEEQVARGEKTIAVLPLNFIGESETDAAFLAVGLADAMITRLSKVNRLIVRPTTSVLQYGKGEDSFEAGRELKVDFVLCGTIRRVGERLRISAQLLDVAANSTRWAERFDEKFDDFLDLEDLVAKKVADLVIPRLTGGERQKLAKRGTDNPQAFEAYLRGRYHLNLFTPEQFAKAKDYFERAIALDKNYALAYVGMADYYFALGTFGTAPPLECHKKSYEMAERALAIDDALGEANTFLGFWHFVDYDYEAVEKYLRRGIELSPNYSLSYIWFSCLMTMFGRHDEAIALSKQAAEINPLSPFDKNHHAWTLYHARRYDQAINHWREILKIAPDFSHGLASFSWALRAAGRIEESLEIALRAAALSGQSTWIKSNLAASYGAAGQPEKAREILRELQKDAAANYASSFCMAIAYANLDDKERAFDFLKKSIEQHDIWYLWIASEPQLDFLRSDARYQNLLRATKNPQAEQHESLEQYESLIDEAPTFSEKTIAVLPFKSLQTGTGNLNEGEFLRIGLADALITRLSSVKRLIVRPTSSVIRFSRAVTDPFVAADEINVQFVVDGHIKLVGDRIRVSVQLLNVAEKTSVWARSFDEKFTDVLTLEDSISEQVTGALLPRLSEDEKQQLNKRPTDNVEAFEAYLRGRYHWSSLTKDGLQKAFECYHQAISYDPHYALAYAGIADYYNWLCVYALMPSAEASAKAKDAANKAIQFDDKLADGFAALGFATLISDLDWQAAEKHLLKAIELNPNYVVGRIWYSYFLGMQKRFDEAFAQIDKALKLDPLAPLVQQTFNWMLYYAGRNEEAVAASYRLIEREPNYGLSFLFFGSLLSHVGKFEEAIRIGNRSVELLGRSPYTLSWLASVYAAAGDREKTAELLAEIEKLSKKQYASPYLVAMVYVNLGETEKTFELLEKAAAMLDARIAWLYVDPRFAPLSDDPRFKKLLKKTKNPAAKI